jgi:tetratricopeptide (TPR) repeat protein
MMPRRYLHARATAVGCLFSIVAGASRAQGQEAETDASVVFRTGAEAYERGEYSAAARAFARAFELKPHAAALFNEAKALERAGDEAGAASNYAAAIERDELREQDAKEARKRLGLLEQRVGRLEIAGSSAIRAHLGRMQPVPLPLRLHLGPGQHEIFLQRGDGATASLHVTTAAGHSSRIVVPDTGPPWPRPHAVELPRAPAAMTRIPTSAYVAFGSAAAAAGLGAYFGLAGLAARRDFEDSGRTDAAEHDRAVHMRTWANVAFASALLAGGIGVVLVYRASSSPLELQLSPTNVGVGGALSLTLRERS